MKGRKILLHIQLNITVSGSVLHCWITLWRKKYSIDKIDLCWHVEKTWQEEMIKFSDPFSQPNHPLDSTTVWKPRPKIHFEPVAKILVFDNLWWKYSPLHSADYKYSLLIHISRVSEYLIEDASPRIWGSTIKERKTLNRRLLISIVVVVKGLTCLLHWIGIRSFFSLCWS